MSRPPKCRLLARQLDDETTASGRARRAVDLAAVRIGDGLDHRQAEATAAAQAEQVLKNLEAVLIAGGASMDRVVKTLIFMTDLKAFAEVNAVYEKAFRGHKPARSTVQVPALPKGALVEIECIAELG